MPKVLLSASRSRVVNFRLTEQEYLDLRRVCSMSGHNLSDFARTAVLEFAQVQPLAEGSLRRQFMNLDEKLSRVIDSLDRIEPVRK